MRWLVERIGRQMHHFSLFCLLSVRFLTIRGEQLAPAQTTRQGKRDSLRSIVAQLRAGRQSFVGIASYRPARRGSGSAGERQELKLRRRLRCPRVRISVLPKGRTGVGRGGRGREEE
jgi:hypothetical protein